MKTLSLLILIVGLASAGAVAVAYWRFRTSPAGKWKAAVGERIAALQRRQAELRQEGARVEGEYTRLADDAYQRYLRTIPISKLDEYPNIGDKTISRLQAAGFRHLADAVNARFEGIPDVGPARVGHLRSAVAAQLKDARSRFDAGACPEAQEYRRRVDALRARDRERSAERARELTATEAAVGAAFDLLPIARRVTFVGFLLQHPVSGLTPDILNRPLPTPMLPPATVTPSQMVAHAPQPPAVPPVAAVVAAEASPAGFPLPPTPPSAPPPPADLFRAALETPNRGASPVAPEYPGLARMRAVIGLGFVVAKADGRVAQSEKKVIRGQLDQLFGHDPVLVRNIDPLMERIEKSAPAEAAALAEIRAHLPASELAAIYQWAERIADASGERNQKEREVLARLADGLGVVVTSTSAPEPAKVPSVPPPLPTTPVKASEPPRPDPRTVLDIAPDVPLDPDLIRRRYQLLTEKLDPAKAAAFGPEFARMAEEKRALVRAAAETLIASFNEPLEKPAPAVPTDLRHNPDLDDVFGA